MHKNYFPKNIYLIGTNYKINKPIFSLSIESSWSNQYGGDYQKLKVSTSKNNFQSYLEDHNEILTAGKEIEKQIKDIRKEFEF